MKTKNRLIAPLLNKRIDARFVAPASKSYGQRALACAMANPNRTEILGLGQSDDEQAVLEIARTLGCELHVFDSNVRMLSRGVINLSETTISCNESGLATRMLIPILANSEREITINGRGSLLNRSMALYDELFKELNVSFISKDGKLPVKVKGPLKPISLKVDASKSSQYLTGLIIAYCASPYLTEATITCENPVSIPYIQLTLEVLKAFGVEVEWKENTLKFNGPYQFKPTQLKVEGDWSSVSFFIVAAAISGSVRISGLNKVSAQADKMILNVVVLFGAKVYWEEDVLIIESKHKNAFEFDATDCPDLFPPLAVMAALANGNSRIKGLHRLFDKESNRALTIQSEWKKFGINVSFEKDEMVVQGVQKLVASEPIESHDDHRIVMAASILGLFAENETMIKNPDAVNKSFPEFFTYLEKLY